MRGKDMSDLHHKIKEGASFRRKWAERCGFGFALLAVAPNTIRGGQLEW